MPTKDEQYRRILLSCPLFEGVENGAELKMPEGARTLSFEKGERVDIGKGALGVLLKGRLRVGGDDGICRAVINEMRPGDVFGFASLYQKDRFENDITACGSVEILKIGSEALEELIARYPGVARSIIAIQAQKIRFLNGRIRSFAAQDAAGRLYTYLSAQKKEEDGSVSVGSMANLAKRLGIGRASLYRAIDRLIAEKKLKKDGGKLFLY